MTHSLYYAFRDSSSAYSRLWLQRLIQKYGNRSQLIFRNDLNFLYLGTNGEIQTLQEAQANCRWAHHLRVGVWPRVSEITDFMLCLLCFAESLPSERMHVLLLPLLYASSPLCRTPHVHPTDAVYTPDCSFVPCVVFSKARLL